MPASAQIEKALKQVHSQVSFFQTLLATTLGWPTGDVRQIEDIAYGWSQQDLNAVGLERNLVEGSIWQIQPAATGQPWGVFVLEFKHEEALSPRRGLAGVLRKVLKGLVGARRKDPNLPSWQREHLLFICTYKWTHFRFAYYRSKPDDQRSARLTTFGWSPDTSNRTVVEFNLPALEWPEDISDADRWIAAWAKAFDKEPLTKDFFKRFDNALDAIKADLQKYQQLSSAEAYTQSQLLLERLIFLYFLQNRGWLNQDRRYLPSRLGEHTKNPQGFTYYQDFLDKLFWTLSTAPLGAGRLPGIPFLNGGLFDDDEFVQPANLRKTTPPLKVRNQSIQYVFQELLEAFNFTVTEDTPLNQEVAVDPEMLGKVFESIVLHAEAADPDAIAPDKRKATGSYYTPRIVVHFICQETLYQYLKNHLPGDGWGPRLKALFSIDPTEGIDEEAKQLLKTTISPEQAVQVRGLVLPLKCCDPAVGSGAFPVGLMHELVNLRRLLETAANGYKDPVVGQGSQWLHEAKAQIVENCLFGVDIQQQAIEICRLRLWLSLIVDYDLGLDPFTAEKSQFSGAIEHISQLPNLEMNFRRADSLHDHISGVPVVILTHRASRHAPEFAVISKLGAELHKAKKAERKKNLRLDILEKRLNLSHKILDEELREIRTRDSSLDSLFGIEESNAKKRERNQREIQQLERALAKVEADRKEMEKLRRRDADSQFYPKLRKLEGADFDSPFNFAWHLDFPGVFAGDGGGFDIIVGNPPFVTARNEQKRELWRQRWPRVCASKYHLLCPFFDLSFGLLRNSGELGFIVSNAFAKRDFGEPLVQKLFPTVELQKVVDCSGLLFPGHGTPTCLVFGSARSPNQSFPIRVTGILPGGGDLRTPPEESGLWNTISIHHDLPDYADSRIVVTDRLRAELSKWPWNFDPTSQETKKTIDQNTSATLRSVLATNIGYSCVTRADEIYFPPLHLLRIASIPISQIAPLTVGDELRNWGCVSRDFALFPYSADLKTIALARFSSIERYLKPFRRHLEDRVAYGKTQIERGLQWFEYSMLFADRMRILPTVAFPDIVSHTHMCRFDSLRVFKDTAPIFSLAEPTCIDATIAVLNSSTALFWLKQICFNKGAGEAEERDRFEFMTGKVEQLPVPQSLVNSSPSATRTSSRLSELSQELTRLGRTLPALSMGKLFDKKGEAFCEWNASLTGFVSRSPLLGNAFADGDSLRRSLRQACTHRDRISGQMIALQEEIDWVTYAAYGLLPEDHPAVKAPGVPGIITRDQRPFRLCAKSDFDYDKTIALIPVDWPAERRKLWQERVTVIVSNEHIRRIEQPVYKRRWDEQWKTGNEWRCGEIAYAAEFIDAFEGWLKEKAEWWLEHKRHGGPVEVGEWTQALWKDDRIQAAWPVAAEQYDYLEFERAREKAEEDGDPIPLRPKLATEYSSFLRKFKEVMAEETVPEGFPFGVDYDVLEKKLKKELPAKLKKVRGKLNVPRERFHSVGPGQYQCAGLQFK
jgi:type I restriction-modification system DNA methylase subunit